MREGRGYDNALVASSPETNSDAAADDEHTHVDGLPERSDVAPPSDVLPVLAPDPLPPGFPVGDYQIETLLGQGGMGAVYRAVQPLIEKRVAIKVLSRQLAESPEAVSRFQKEARAVNQIGHKNIIDVYNFGQLPDGRHYYVMEFVRGETLRERIDRDHGLALPEALPIFRDIVRALQAAHAKAIVHRDLKPENVMLSPDEDGLVVKLLDFGVAKLLSGERAGENQTEKGIALGTPKYMSPEQCTGGVVDARADLYALGVMLFEAIVGRAPFDAPHYFQIFDMHLRATRPVPSIEAPDKAVPPAFDALVTTLMDREPQNRLQSAQELLEALDRIQQSLSRGGAVQPLRQSLPPSSSPVAPGAPSGRMPLPVIEPASRVASMYQSLQAPVLSTVTLDAIGEGTPQAIAPPGQARVSGVMVPAPLAPLLPDPGPLLPIEPPAGVVSLRFRPNAAPDAPPEVRDSGPQQVRRVGTPTGDARPPSAVPNRGIPIAARELPSLQRPTSSGRVASASAPSPRAPPSPGRMTTPPRSAGRGVPVATIVVIGVLTAALASFLLLR